MQQQQQQSEAAWDELWSQQETAARLRVTVRTLQRWRAAEQGPPAIMLGVWPRYAKGDVMRWLAARKQQQPGEVA